MNRTIYTIAILSLFSAAAWPQPNATGGLAGTVVDDNGKPISGAYAIVTGVPGLADPLVQALTIPTTCSTTLLFDWLGRGKTGIGKTNDGLTTEEQLFANQFLISRTGNAAPPKLIPADKRSPTDPGFVNGRDYRLYQRFQAYYELNSQGIVNANSVGYLQSQVLVGVTPEPCSSLQLFSKAVETHRDTNTSGSSLNGTIVYQINEARLGPDGQALNQFLNGPAVGDFIQATPWIWTAIQFDANGKLQAWKQGGSSGNLQVFPRYDIYTNGSTPTDISQGSLTAFILLNALSQYGGIF